MSGILGFFLIIVGLNNTEGKKSIRRDELEEL